MERFYLHGMLLNEMQVRFFLSIGYEPILIGVIDSVWIYELEGKEND